jgi:hypothetical protein
MGGWPTYHLSITKNLGTHPIHARTLRMGGVVQC